ncbi:MAG: DUF177 domain-containing protein [Hyphomicrobium sp.]|uniref:YceD family protein n=1 Tax=Hyphomicrobium sp. TaxID=82 RepID=UPI0039E3A5BD
MTDTLDWAEKTTDIPAGGLDRQREATADELGRIAKALDILSVADLSSHYRIVAISGGAYRLSGSISANVEQACVVSLEPVRGAVKAAFDVEFWPDLKSEESEEEASILSGSDVELLEHGLIPVGRIVFETLSASLDPYPRREGAEFDWKDPKVEEPGAHSPFATLAKLKDKG